MGARNPWRYSGPATGCSVRCLILAKRRKPPRNARRNAGLPRCGRNASVGSTRIPNRAAGTTGASGGGDRVSDGVLKLGQDDALSTSHYHDSGSSIVRQVVPGRGRRERLAPCARNKTPLRSTAAWPARRAHAAPTEPVAGRRRRGYAPQGPKRWASAVRRTHDQQPAGATRASASCARNKTPLRSTAAWPARRARPAPREAPAERRWRREAPPAYSTETRVTAGRASGLVDGRRRPSTALHAAETPPRAAAGCVATAAARLAAVDPASPLGAAYILDRDSGHGWESVGAVDGRR